MDERPFYDLLLLAQAGRYNLYDFAERGRSNEDLMALFYLLQQKLRPNLTFEIGALEGQFSLAMRQFDIPAYAFEANPYIFRHFTETGHFARAGVDYHHLAVGSETGATRFNIQKTIGGKPVDPSRGDNSLLTRTREDTEYEEVMVPCTSLDAFIRERNLEGQPFSAWIDVEGATGAVLQGAEQSLASCLSLMVEVEQHKFWNEQWLAWEVMDFLLERDFIPVNRDFEYAHQYNIVFVRKHLLERLEVREALALSFTRGYAGRARSS